MIRQAVHAIMFILISIVAFWYNHITSIVFLIGFSLSFFYYYGLRVRLSYRFKDSPDYWITLKELGGMTILSLTGVLINLIYLTYWIWYR